MTVESQNYNTVPERIWDVEQGGFRPLTEQEREDRTRNRSRRQRGHGHLDPDEAQDLQDYLEYVREHLDE